MRQRRPLFLAIGLLVLVAAATAGILASIVKRAPAFYSAAAPRGDYETRERASHLLTRIQDLKNDIRTNGKWGATFSVADLNCFFAEMMAETGSLTDLLPKGFHSPRVAIEGDRLKLGFRYGRGFWSTIVWIDLRIWLVADETNLMAVEVCDLRAGQLGVGTQSILDAIGDAARSSNIDVTWYRYNGNPVGLFRFFPDQPRPASQVLTLQVSSGEIVIAGVSIASEASMAPLPAIKP